MVQEVSTTKGRRLRQSHVEMLEQATLYMVETLPRLFKTVKQRLRGSETGHRELGESQMWVLHMLTGGSQLTGELARHFNVTTPTMTRIVDGLVEKGFVERRPDPDDRRRICLEVTERGAESAKRAHAHFRDALTNYLAPLTAEQLADLVLALRHLQSLLPEEHAEQGEKK